MLKNTQELIPRNSAPRGRIVSHAAQTQGDLGEDSIPALVTERFIHLFETVNVDPNKRKESIG